MGCSVRQNKDGRRFVRLDDYGPDARNRGGRRRARKPWHSKPGVAPLGLGLLLAAIAIGSGMVDEVTGGDAQIRAEAALPAAAATAITASFAFCSNGGQDDCVVDGDTFRVGGEKVRIAGIDAPETSPSRCPREAELGRAATEELHRLLNGGAITLVPIDRDRDRYGRLLREVTVNGADVGETMIAAGVARPYAGGRRSWCG